MGHVWLIGMMGSGKTSVGRLLSDRLELPFYDTDATVEANAGQTVGEIFSNLGEPRFRELETLAVRAIASQDDGVVSTGGGIVLDLSNVEAMRESGTTVLLDADVGALIERVAAAAERPLISEDPGRHLREIASARAAAYENAADVVVDAIGSIEDVAHRVEAACSVS